MNEVKIVLDADASQFEAINAQLRALGATVIDGGEFFPNPHFPYPCPEPNNYGPHPPKDDDPTNPSHYRKSNIECIDAIQNALTPIEFRGHCIANAMKYLWRHKDKGGKTDLQKAIWYIDRAVRSYHECDDPDPR